MQQYVWPSLTDRIDEILDKIIIFRPSNPPVLPTDIERIGEVPFIVGADIQRDRQRCRGMQTGASGV